MRTLDLSVVIPLYNEEGALSLLYQRLGQVLGTLGKSYELVFVNDGSSDGSAAVLDELARRDTAVTVVHFRRNFGKAAALDAGFSHARGHVVVTMDADLQDEPAEIPRFLAKLDEGFDVISGWKKKRHDPIGKTLPSKIFNFVVSLFSGLKLHDFNCGFKAYRRDAVENLKLYGEMHRYIPVLLYWQGFSVSELAVEHHPRTHGRSKYGVERFAKGFFDLLTVVLTTRFRARPLHLFGLAGLFLGAFGVLALAYLSSLWFLGERPIGNRPLLFLGLLLVMVGVQFVSIGLLGELFNRSQNSPKAFYVIRKVHKSSSSTKTAALVE